MAIRQGGTTVIDDSRNVVNANAVMLNGEFTPHVGEGPNILWSAAGSLVSTFDNPNAYNTSTDDRFGSTTGIAISGNYAIVGAYQEDDAGGTESGKAYIFNVTTGLLLWTLNNPNTLSSSTNDVFGFSVSISNNYAIVGAQREQDAGGTDSGKAYIYNVTTGALVHTLNNPTTYSTSQNDRFGWSVAISGNYAIVGAYQEDDAEGTSSGKAYIFNVTTGALLWTLNNPNVYSTSFNDRFGVSVAISGNYAIVGAFGESDEQGITLSGKAYIFNVTTGALVHTLNNPNAYSTSLNDEFGISIAISDNYAIVGARSEDDASGTFSGKAYIFNVTTGALLWTLNNPNVYSTSLDDRFGWSVAISGNYAVVGADQEDDAGGTESGKAYIFNVTTGALVWTLDNPNAYSTSATDLFGRSVAISDNYAVIGADAEDDILGTSSGKVYTFALNTTYRTGKPLTTASDFGYVRKNAAGSLVWTLDNPNAYSTGTDDLFGINVAISGNYAIVGANAEDDAGGITSGKAYIYNVTNGALVHTLNNPNAYSTVEGDQFGYSVGISDRYAIVGAPYEDDPQPSSASAGRVYIFDITNGSLIQSIRNPTFNTGGWNSGMNFGYSVGISGNYAIVGTPNRSEPLSSAGKVYIFNVTTGALVWTLNNPNAYDTQSGDTFGWSVGISGNYAIVGTPNEDSAVYPEFGIAYIFNVATGQLLWTLNNPNAYSGSFNADEFGNVVAISGNYAIVGAWREDDSGGTESGKAYIFNVTTGALVHTLNNPNAYGPTGNDQFGYSVGISGNYAIVGARLDSDSGGSFSGRSYIFNVTTGALVHTLSNPNAYSTSVDDQFGSSVSISSNYVIVGAHFEDDIGGTTSGKAYIFSINDTYRLTNVEEVQLANGMKISADNKLLQQSVPAGALIHKLDNPNAYGASFEDNFGWAVAISGNYAIVGAYGEADTGGTGSGKAHIFNITTGQLLWTLNNPNPFGTSQSDNFGYRVAISGNYAIVGAYFEDDAGGIQSGKAYIFNATTGQLLWTLNNPNAYGTSGNDYFGSSISISGNYAIVGAAERSSGTGEDDAGGANSGKAYIFNVTTGALVHTLNNPNAYSTSADDQFGVSVAVSGNYAIVGAQGEDDVGGSASGKAYIFNVTTGQLLWTLNNPNAYSTSQNDYFGYTLDISGNYAIVGAFGEDDAGGANSSKAYIFNATTGQLVHTLNNPNAYSTTNLDYFGTSVAISGNYAIVGANEEDDNGGIQSGKAYIYNVTTGALVHTLNNPNAYSTSGADFFGWSVYISENYTIVGAPREDDAGGITSGKAYIFSVRDLTYLDRLVQMVS